MKRCIIYLLLAIPFYHFAQVADSLSTVTIVSKTPENPSDFSQNVQIISEENLKEYQAWDLSQILQLQSGFQINGANLNAIEPKSISVRGSRNNGIVILIDGIPQKDVTNTDYTLTDIRNYDLSQFKKIEILNQASSVVYGSNASVSVINLIRKDAKKSSANIGVKMGSFNTIQESGNFHYSNGSFGVQLNVSNAYSDGISSALGEGFDKDGYQKSNLQGTLNYRYKNWNAQLGYEGQNLDYKFDEAAFVDSNDKGKNKNNGVHFLLKNTSEKNLFQLSLKQLYNSRTYDYGGNGDTDYKYKGKFFYLDAIDTYTWNRHWKSTAGITFEHQILNYNGIVYDANFQPNYESIFGKDSIKQSSVDFYGEVQFHVKDFYIKSGLRYNTHSIYKGQLVYSINPFWSKNIKENQRVKLGLTAASAYISPTLYQFYGNGSPYLIPNKKLVPETNQSMGFDASYFHSKWSIFGSIFYRKEKNKFVYTSNSTTYVAQYQNLANNEAWGWEFGGEVQLGQKFHLKSNVSYAKNQKIEAQFRLPKYRVNAALDAHLIKGNSVSLQYQFVDKKPDAYFSYDTYSQVKVEDASYSLFSIIIQQKIQDHWVLNASIQNLLNTKYVDIVGYNSVGTNFTLGVNFLL